MGAACAASIRHEAFRSPGHQSFILKEPGAVRYVFPESGSGPHFAEAAGKKSIKYKISL